MFGKYVTRELTSHKFKTDEHYKRAIKSARRELHIAISKCGNVDVLDKALDVINNPIENKSGHVAEK